MHKSMNGKNLMIVMIGVFLIIGIWVRYAYLDSHFTHVDDIDIAHELLVQKGHINKSNSDFKIVKMFYKPAHVISSNLTYAPLQFFTTSWFVDADQSYKEILFWGRFPSFVFAVLGLLGIIFFYWKFKPENFLAAALISLSVLALSWENIIYAQQMESYAIGVFSILLVLVTLLYYIKKQDLSIRDMILLGLISAAISHTQYQILFFIPALYLVLFIKHWKSFQSKKELFKFFSISGGVFILLIMPMYFGYLSQHTNAGINWNAGPEKEFLFDMSKVKGGFETFLHAVRFFMENFITVFHSEIAFMPENSLAFQIVINALLVFFIFGIISFIDTADSNKIFLGLFFLIATLIWMALIILQKLALSPTRHNLILLPFFAICIAEGVIYFVEKITLFRNKIQIQRIGSIALSLGMVLLFCMSFSEVVNQRKDPFSSDEIETVLTKYKVNAVIPYAYTRNIGIMKNIKDKFKIEEAEGWKLNDGQRDSLKTICLISSRIPYPYRFLNSTKGFLSSNKEIMPVLKSDADYRLIHKQEISSDVEVDFSNKTKNGTNNFYLYIFRRK